MKVSLTPHMFQVLIQLSLHYQELFLFSWDPGNMEITACACTDPYGGSTHTLLNARGVSWVELLLQWHIPHVLKALRT